VASPGKCNPAAHGHMVSEEVCLVCGQTRMVAYNQSHVECSEWAGRPGASSLGLDDCCIPEDTVTEEAPDVCNDCPECVREATRRAYQRGYAEGRASALIEAL
jgi:hypothetical protein